MTVFFVRYLALNINGTLPNNKNCLGELKMLTILNKLSKNCHRHEKYPTKVVNFLLNSIAEVAATFVDQLKENTHELKV